MAPCGRRGLPDGAASKQRAKLLGRASAPGILYDFGRYPGALFQPESKDRIVGHVLALRNAERLLKELDAYEGIIDPATGFYAHRARGPPRQRRRVDAWAYGLLEPPARARRIGSGDFIAHPRRNPASAPLLTLRPLAYLCRAERTATRASHG